MTRNEEISSSDERAPQCKMKERGKYEIKPEHQDVFDK